MFGKNWKGKWGAIATAVGAVAAVVAQISPEAAGVAYGVADVVGRIGELLFGGGAALSLYGIREAQGKR